MGLRYTLTPLGFVEGVDATRKIEIIDLTAKDLKAVEQSRLEVLQVTKSASPSLKLDIDDPDYDEYDDDEESKEASSSTALQKTQTLAHIRLTKPGTVRLERVLDTSNVDARLIYPWDVTVAPCPRAEFQPDEISRRNDVRCAAPGIVSGRSGSAAGEDLKFNLDIFGVPPLSLRWFKDVNGKREHFTVEGIEADHVDGRTRTPGSEGAQMLQVPLTVSLDAIGAHNYVLESVTDRFGNHINIGASSGHSKSKWARSITVLRRPNVSFKTCGPGKPSSLLIGSETPITITTHEADPLDAPWDITVKYLPLSNKGLRPWQRKLKTRKDQRDLVLKAGAPGEYTILGVRGAYCEGDVLSPEVCKVVEMPYPSAEIEWKKIHEWYLILNLFLTFFSRAFTQALEILVYLPPLSYMGPHHSTFTTVCNAIKSLHGSLPKPSQLLEPTSRSSQIRVAITVSASRSLAMQITKVWN
jgi:nucleoporin POM152